MKKIFALGLLAAGCILSASTLQAQTRGQTITLMIPKEFLKPNGTRIYGNPTNLPVFAALIRQTGSTITVNDVEYSPAKNAPLLQEFKIDKVSEDKDKGQKIEYVEVEMSNIAAVVKLRFVKPIADLESSMKRVAALGSRKSAAVDEFLRPHYESIRKAIFKSPIDVDEATQLKILKAAMVDVEASSLQLETFKDVDYLSMEFGSGEYVYNDLQLNQAGRLAKMTNESLLEKFKTMIQAIGANPSIQGIAAKVSIKHKNFTNQYAAAATDSVVFYLPAAKLRQFANADITSQQLMDASTVLVNGNRVQVNLGGQ